MIRLGIRFALALGSGATGTGTPRPRDFFAGVEAAINGASSHDDAYASDSNPELEQEHSVNTNGGDDEENDNAN
jgi:hypothetical protein